MAQKIEKINPFEEMIARLDRWMRKAFKNVWEVSVAYKTSMRIAAYIFALKKVAKGMKSRRAF